MAISKTYTCRFCGGTFKGDKDYFHHLYTEKVKRSPLSLYWLRLTLEIPFDEAYMCDYNEKMQLDIVKEGVFEDNSGQLRYYSFDTVEHNVGRKEDISEEQLDSLMEIVPEEDRKSDFWKVIKPKQYISHTDFIKVKDDEVREKTIELLEIYGKHKAPTEELTFTTLFSDWDKMKNRLVALQKAMPFEWLRERVKESDGVKGKTIRFIADKSPLFQKAVKEALVKPEIQQKLKKNLENKNECRVYDIYRMSEVPEGMHNSLNMIVYDSHGRLDWR